MVKRAKLTLDHSDVADETVAGPQGVNSETDADKSPSAKQEQSMRLTSSGKLLLIAGLTIASLVILRRKIF